MGIFDKLLRAGEGRKLKGLQQLVPDINALEPEMEALSDDALRHKTVEFREQLDRATSDGDNMQEAMNDLLIPAFAVVREASKRVLGQRHFDVQLMGGAALHFGWIAEMKTGEGKTLVATLPVYLNGLTGRGVHLVTVNDYLARFQSEWMGRLYNWLGLSVGLVVPEVNEFAAVRRAYECDVTYGTNTEFGFDYLRDNMAKSRDHMRQRGHVYAIIDEVDSILIDEARTPLIISAPAQDQVRLYNQFAGIARALTRDVDYEVDEAKRTVSPTEAGIEKVERMLGVDNLYDLPQANFVHQLQQSLRAKELYKRDKDYVVLDGEVKIVDEFTGRILEGRRWSDGLHQAVEAKERVGIRAENHTYATVTLQNYFRMYEKLAGMTGTAETEAAEFANTYDLPVVPIPTNRPMVRQDHGDLIYKTEQAKFNAVVDDIVERYEQGQPVLVGTASVEKSELLSTMLQRRGIPHSVLNAKQHAREAAIVAQAGRLHSVTVATNMAGRGVDILLGGNPEGLAREEVVARGVDPNSEEGQALYRQLLPGFEEQCRAEGEKIKALGGLYVLGSERHESRRIDNQLRGRAGRQGDPGESRFYLSLEDDLMRLFATGAMNWVMGRTLPEDVPIEAKMVTRAIEKAQTTVEAKNAEVRKNVLKYDEVMNAQRKVIYARRMEVLEGESLRDETVELLEETAQQLVDTYCAAEFPEDWDLDGLITEALSYWPTEITAERVKPMATREEIAETLTDDILAHYERRENEMPGGAETMRELERRIMLEMIDQHWVEHLSEMDYLQEGINLRAMGQKDPLVEWQREGFDMFGKMMDSISDNYVKYVMHAQVVVQEQEPEEVDLSQAQFQAADNPVQSPGVQPQPTQTHGPSQPATPSRPASLAAGATPEDDRLAQGRAAAEQAGKVQAPIVKDERERLGRNDPCWCGSGRKFKHCHGQ